MRISQDATQTIRLKRAPNGTLLEHEIEGMERSTFVVYNPLGVSKRFDNLKDALEAYQASRQN